MKKVIRKGDIVGRKSYGKDILFVVEKIIKTSNCNFCILKGLTVRIEADSPLEDLELVEKERILAQEKYMDEVLKNRVKDVLKKIRQTRNKIRNECKILHLDGDRRYSEKSAKYYKDLGLNAIVKNVPENRQCFEIKNLLQRYKPDILVITGHDAMLKNGRDYNNIYNYRNSRYFVQAVREARNWQPDENSLVIFARCVSKLF